VGLALDGRTVADDLPTPPRITQPAFQVQPTVITLAEFIPVQSVEAEPHTLLAYIVE